MEAFVRVYFDCRRRGMKPLYAAILASSREACTLYFGPVR